MSDQVLGIKIQLDTGDLAAQLADLQKKLGSTLGTALGKSTESGVSASKDQLGKLQESFDKTFKGIEKKAEESKDRMLKNYKRMAELGTAGATSAEHAKELTKLANSNKGFSDLTKRVVEYTKTVETSDGRLISFVSHQKELAAAARKAAQELKEQTQISGAKGFEYLDPKNKNAGYVKSSFIKDQGVAWDQAHIQQTAQLAKGLKSVGDNADHANKKQGLLNITLGNLTTHLAAFYSIRNVLFAIGAQFRQVVTGAIDFDQKIHDIAAIAGSSKTEMQEMGASILQIATSSRYSAAEVGELMEVLAQAGVLAKDLPTVANTVGMFATGTGATPQQAAEVFTTAANVWRISAEDSSRVANVLTAALNNSKLSVQGLATSFSYLAPQAAMIGYTLEDTAGMVASLSQVGIKASTIGTGLSQLLKDLSAPKPRFAAMLKTYEISLDQINPRFHKFADVIAVFNQRGVSAVDIMSKMDSRSGRSLVASMLAGAAAIKTMTESVTGTTAAVRAYETAMEGARAKMNVLKQEVLKASIDIGNPIGRLFSGIVEGTTLAIQGLATVNGRLIIVASSVAALTAVAALNPIFAGVTVGIVAVATALAWVGRETDTLRLKIGQDLDEATEKAANLQRVQTLIDTARNEATYLDAVTMAKAKSLMMDGKLIEAAKLLDSTKAKVSASTVASIKEELALLKELGVALDPDNLTLGSLNRAGGQIKNTTNSTITAVFNKNLADLKAQEKELKEELRINKEILANSTGVDSGLDFTTGTARTKVKDLSKGLAANQAQQARVRMFASQAKGPVEEIDKRAKELQDALAKYEQQEKDAAEIEANKKFDFATWGKDQLLQSEIDARKSRISILTNTFDDEKIALEQKTDNYLEAYRLAQEEITTEIEKKAAEAQSNYNKSNKTPVEAAILRDLMTSLNNQGQADLDKWNDSSVDKLHKGADTKTGKDGGLEGQRTEKRQAISLGNLQRANALRKEAAMTAQEQLDIDLETGAAAIRSLDVTKTAYQNDLDKLSKSKELQEANKQYYEDLPDMIENVNIKLQETLAAQGRLADQSLWGNMTQGVKQGVQALGTMKSATVDLGQSVVSTFTGGISNALDGMLTKIREGQSGWTSFRDTMGSVLGDIGKMLQQYLIKLLVIWAVQKMIGFAAGSSATEGMSTDGNSLMGWSSVDGAGGAGFAPSGNYSLMAEGGLVPLNMGIPGKDSVPALLMPNEFVIPSYAVNKYGVDHFEKYRKNAFATGGLVGPRPAGSDKEKEGEGEVTLQIINVVDPASIPRTTSAQILNTIALDALQNGPTYRTLKSKLQAG